MIRRILNYIKNPIIFVRVLLNMLGPFIKNDVFFVKLKWILHMPYPLDLNNPKTFNEKLQWLKLYDRRPNYTKLVDKYEVKEYVANIIGNEHIIPTLALYENVEDINFDELPDQFVLKCTHDSGGLVICKDKSQFDVKQAIKTLKHYYARKYYWQSREWPYKNVKPRIVVEKYMEDKDGELKDYKVFNFNGEPRIIEIDYNRFTNHQRTLFDENWNVINATIKFPTDKKREFKKPEVFEELLELSRKLSKGFPHLRTDFYIVDNKIYFGELTFYHGSGMERINPIDLDYKMGEWINLPLR